jgi:exodeoxyribonuclease V alpha subunit
MSMLHVDEVRLSALDRALVALFESRLTEPCAPLSLAVALVSNALSQGHVCLTLDTLVATRADWCKKLALNLGASASLEEEADQWPKGLEQWRECLLASGLVDALGAGFLVLSPFDRLYIPKMYRLESRLLYHLQQRSSRSVAVDYDAANRALQGLFPVFNPAEPDWQQLAACVALLNRFAVISGGPGTGKTTTVIRLMALLLSQRGEQVEPLERAVLVAPTGKAAARLSESISAKLDELGLDESLVAKIPREAQTIHRLLGVNRDGQFRHNAHHRLNVDLIVIDEASMVDLPMMVRLLEALPDHTRVILLGDKDQLASVEAGSVLAELCQKDQLDRFSFVFGQKLERLLMTEGVAARGAAARAGSIAGLSIEAQVENAPVCLFDSVIELKKSYRFTADSGIGQLAYATNHGDVNRALAVLRAESYTDVSVFNKPESGLCQALVDQAVRHYTDHFRPNEPVLALAAFSRFRVLAGVKEGPSGSYELNEAIASGLQAKGLVRSREHYYHGLPVMVLQNSYQVGLFNGDVGLFYRMKDSGELRVVFDDGQGGYRDISPALLPKWEPAYVMTVHKSQGSEFDSVAMILPEQSSPLLTREMLYTGVTRAKSRLSLYAQDSELEQAIQSRVERCSGLSDRLWS